MTEPIRVLHVDDEPGFAELVASALPREDDRLTVRTARDADEGLAALADHEVDCVVSDYEMPGRNGIEFLRAVREDHPELPFILYTGKGSEAVASDAISAGVTDYLQKETGTGQYELLANRITNAVAQTRTEQELRAEQRRFQVLFERLTQATVEVEYQDDEPIVQRVNPAFETAFGYDAAEIVGESLDEFIVPEEWADEADQINQYVQTGGRLESEEVTRRTADGEREFLLQNAVYEDGSGGFAIYTDISDRKQREQRLQAQRYRLEQLHEATRELMAAETRDGIAGLASETARDVLALPLSGVYLHDPERNALVPVAVTDAVYDVLGDPPVIGPGEGLTWEAYEAGEPRIHDDVREAPAVLNPDTPIRSELVLPLGEHGAMTLGSTEPRAFAEIDVSLARIFAEIVEAALERAEREERIREHEAELARQNDRLDEFASIVSHDLRSPLAVAAGHVELARGERDGEHLVAAEQALDRTRTLVDDLLAVARIGEAATGTAAVPLREVTERAWRTVETGEATLRIDTDRVVEADESRLQQLLENLLRNAVQHVEGPVTVTVGDLDGEDGFYVADDGPGIPPGEREQVFERGYSTADGGTGYGLRIVEQVADAHGWTVRATDGERDGARFEITGVSAD